MEKFIKFVIVVILLQAICFNMPAANSFFSNSIKSEKLLSTGSVNIIIDNLNKADDILQINSSQAISFALKNNGKSDADYILNIQIAWDDKLNEAGKFFVYPSDINDDIIYSNLLNKDYSNAIIGLDLEEKEITGSTGILSGISGTVDTGTLNAFSDYATAGFKDYGLKLFFFADAEIAANPGFFNNKSIEVGIVVHTDVKSRKTNWKTTESRFFRYESFVNAPVISEVNLPKTFFVTQTSDLDLKAYASAFDTTEGDISGKIQISSFPEFKKGQAGVYEVTYNVANNSGINAIPLKATIVVWNFIKIESGSYHALALTSHGKVYAWGNNYYGQLGNGTNQGKHTPNLIEGLNDIVDIAAANDCSFALSADGQIYSWGLNDNGRLGDNTTIAKSRPAKVSQPEGVRFTQISADFSTVAAITSEGDVYTWGYGGYGSLGDGGTSDRYTPAQVLNLSNIVKVSISRFNGAAITDEGKLFTWGFGSYGRLGNGISNSIISAPILVTYFNDMNVRIKDISVGQNAMAAVSESGQLFTWGYGGEGQLGNGGTDFKSTPQVIPLPAAAKKAAVSDNHTGVMTEDGSVFFFGQNSYGQQGSGDTETHLIPTLLQGVPGASSISLSANSSFVLVDSSTLYGMGYGSSGLLANGKTENSAIPVVWAFVPPLPY